MEFCVLKYGPEKVDYKKNLIIQPCEPWKRKEASLEDELETTCDQVGKMTLKVEKC